jgi:hypothetical protein
VMNSPGELAKEVRLMTFDVIVLQQVDNGYSARPVLWPDSVAHGATEQEALDRVRTLIRDLLSRTRFVQVEVDVKEHQFGNPWLAKAGTFADDPTWDDFLKAMANYRRQLIEEQAPGQE